MSIKNLKNLMVIRAGSSGDIVSMMEEQKYYLTSHY